MLAGWSNSNGPIQPSVWTWWMRHPALRCGVGRFPAYPAPFRTSVGFQAAHLDLGFYEKFYRPEALGDAHRTHDAIWHPR